MSAELQKIMADLEKGAGFIQRAAQGITHAAQDVANQPGVRSLLNRGAKAVEHGAAGAQPAQAAQQAAQAIQHSGEAFQHIPGRKQTAFDYARKPFDPAELAQRPTTPAGAGRPVLDANALQAPTLGQRARALAPTAVGGAGAAALGYSGYQGMRNSAEQDTRAQDYMANMRHDLTSPVPSMTVTASYEKFASEKLANGPQIFSNTQTAMAKSVGDTLSNKLIADPIDALHATLKKRYFDEPKWQNNFNTVIQDDPALAKAHKENPAMFTDAFSSVKRFSPTLAKDRLATRNLLRHVLMSGGELDYSTMKMLAETEKFHNESKRR